MSRAKNYTPGCVYLPHGKHETRAVNIRCLFIGICHPMGVGNLPFGSDEKINQVARAVTTDMTTTTLGEDPTKVIAGFVIPGYTYDRPPKLDSLVRLCK